MSAAEMSTLKEDIASMLVAAEARGRRVGGHRGWAAHTYERRKDDACVY